MSFVRYKICSCVKTNWSWHLNLHYNDFWEQTRTNELCSLHAVVAAATAAATAAAASAAAAAAAAAAARAIATTAANFSLLTFPLLLKCL